MTAAQLKGQTLLPIPQGGPEDLSSTQATVKQDQLQVLEAAALTWTRQIKQALHPPGFESLEVGCRTKNISFKKAECFSTLKSMHLDSCDAQEIMITFFAYVPTTSKAEQF